jgi:hypothetical protein
MTTPEQMLVERLNTGRWAPAVGIDRAKLLPGPVIRVQVGVRLLPKKATLFDALTQTIEQATQLGLHTFEVERQTRESFIIHLFPAEGS